MVTLKLYHCNHSLCLDHGKVAVWKFSIIFLLFCLACSIVLLAGDTLPIEVYCHLPIMCEDKNLPYTYVPSKLVSCSSQFCAWVSSRCFVANPSPSPQDLGASAGSKRPTCVILIKPHEDYQEAYNECLEEVTNMPKPLWALTRNSSSTGQWHFAGCVPSGSDAGKTNWNVRGLLILQL